MKHGEIVAVAKLLAESAGFDSGVAYGLVADAVEAYKKTARPEPEPLKPVFYDSLEQANTARQREWDGGEVLDLSFLGNALAGEVGEACNIIKKLERERLGLKGSRASKLDLAPELADIVIYTSLIAIKCGVELDLAIFEKFNATSEKLGFKTRLR